MASFVVAAGHAYRFRQMFAKKRSGISRISIEHREPDTHYYSILSQLFKFIFDIVSANWREKHQECGRFITERQRRHFFEDFEKIEKIAGFRIPSVSVMPSVTPVCYGTIFTGAALCVHGIQKCEKPVIQIPTLNLFFTHETWAELQKGYLVFDI